VTHDCEWHSLKKVIIANHSQFKSTIVCKLEIFNGDKVSHCCLLFQRNIWHPVPPMHADTVKDPLSTALSSRKFTQMTFCPTVH
jgi:hypothetical protein